MHYTQAVLLLRQLSQLFQCKRTKYYDNLQPHILIQSAAFNVHKTHNQNFRFYFFQALNSNFLFTLQRIEDIVAFLRQLLSSDVALLPLRQSHLIAIPELINDDAKNYYLFICLFVQFNTVRQDM